MNLITDDVVIEYILPYITDYDIFTCRNTSTWWRQRYKDVQERFLDNVLMSDILEWNDPNVLYEIEREQGEDTLFDNITFDTRFLFDGSVERQPLLDALLRYIPFVKYIQKVLQDPDVEDSSENDLVVALSSYILLHESVQLLLGTESTVWTSLLYGTYANRHRDDYDAAHPVIEAMVSLIEKHSLTIDAQRIVDGMEYTFNVLHMINPHGVLSGRGYMTSMYLNSIYL